MPVTVLVGGQFGSEGKGKIAAYLAKEVRHAVRTGGPNAGHTISTDGKRRVLRCLPCALCQDYVKLYLGAGTLIDLEILAEEMKTNDVSARRLVIDPIASIIRPEYIDAERGLIKAIGSTGKGVGSAVAAKVMRSADVLLARDVPQLHPLLGDVSGLLHDALKVGQRVLVEGTQGTGLSLHHGFYPYVTSRDVTAGALCGEVGLGPTAVDRVILVVRTYPIRVGGPSGPLPSELDWETVTRRSGYEEALGEYTTVTGLLRRVAEFDISAVERAVRLNGATDIALTFADYLDAKVRNVSRYVNLSSHVQQFIETLEDKVCLPVSLVGTGPDTASIIDRR